MSENSLWVKARTCKVPKCRMLFLLSAVVVIVSLGMPLLIVNAQTPASWTKVPSPTDASIRALDMINSTDGWAVGTDGCTIHWDGTSWNNVTSPTGAWLNAVDMVSSTDGWIVGDNGTIYHLQEEEPSFIPADYLLIIAAIIFVLVVSGVWLWARNKKTKGEIKQWK